MGELSFHFAQALAYDTVFPLFCARWQEFLQRMRYFLIILTFLLVGSLVGGCGKKEEPTTPYNVPSAFPRIYPPLEKEEGTPEDPIPLPS